MLGGKTITSIELNYKIILFTPCLALHSIGVANNNNKTSKIKGIKSKKKGEKRNREIEDTHTHTIWSLQILCDLKCLRWSFIKEKVKKHRCNPMRTMLSTEHSRIRTKCYVTCKIWNTGLIHEKEKKKEYINGIII